MRKTCVFLFVNSVFIFRIANTFVASHAMKYSENVFVIRKFLAYTSPHPPPPPPQLYMLATALKLESGIHYSFGIRNPRYGIRNPRSRIRNPSSGIRNPNTSWITSHGAIAWLYPKFLFSNMFCNFVFVIQEHELRSSVHCTRLVVMNL